MTAGLAILFTIGAGLLVVLGVFVAYIVTKIPARPPTIEESPGFPIEPKTSDDETK